MLGNTGAFLKNQFGWNSEAVPGTDAENSGKDKCRRLYRADLLTLLADTLRSYKKPLEEAGLKIIETSNLKLLNKSSGQSIEYKCYTLDLKVGIDHEYGAREPFYNGISITIDLQKPWSEEKWTVQPIEALKFPSPITEEIARRDAANSLTDELNHRL